MKRPNVLLITSDQQHWNTLGVLNPEIRTPQLDALAAQGTLFERAYCPNPTCTPTRASMITGTYPSQHGAYSLGTKLDERAHTIGEDFRAAVYRTALIGKAHFQPLAGTREFPSLEAYPILQDLDFWRGFHGPFYGFDHVELARNHTDEAHVGQHYAIWLEERGCANWREYFRKPTGTADRQGFRWAIPERFHYNAWIAERAGAQIDEAAARGQPFFCWASFFDPHPPCMAPEPWDAMYNPASLTLPRLRPGEHDRNPPHFRLTQEETPDFSSYRTPGGQWLHGMHSHRHDEAHQRRTLAAYYGMVSLLDKYVGLLLDRLDRSGLAGDTLVVFTSDHGHLLGQHGLIAKGPFHYEDLIRVPFLVRWPGRVPAGRRSTALQSLVDLPQTFLSCCGIPAPRGRTGVDQHAVWTGAAEGARSHVLVENNHQPWTVDLRTYVDERWKLTVYLNRPYGELFDLREDPGEFENRWDDPAYAAIKSELLLRFLHAEMAREPIPMPRVHGA